VSEKSTLDEYSLEIIARCQAGEERCRRLLGADFASDAPRHLAQTLLNIFGYLARVATAIETSINWNGTDELIQKMTRSLRVLDWQVKTFGAHIRYVESARTDRLPWQVIPSFEKLVDALQPGAKVMLRPMWQYNYATIVSDLREVYLSELVEYEFYLPETDVESHIVAPLGRAFHIISFPALERDNILLHSVIGHELGHLIATRLVEDAKGAFLALVQKDLEAETDTQLSGDGITGQNYPLWYQQARTARLTYNSNIALKFWERAMEEILADVVGAVLFGPAALFSTFEIALQSGFDLNPSPQNEYYPPWRTRIREVLAVVDSVAAAILSPEPDLFLMPVPLTLTNRAEALGLDRQVRSRLIRERIQKIRDVSTGQDDSTAVSYDPFAKIAYRALRSFIDAATLQIKVLLGKRAFNENQVSSVLPALIERLDAGVPPNAEHDMPSRRLSKVALVDVLNSACFHKASLAIAATNEGDRELLERVRSQRNRLTLKAVEYAFLAEEHPFKAVRRLPTPRLSTTSGVLTSDDIHEHMERKVVLERLIVTPLFDASQSLVDSALDVRLGTEFILFRKEAFNALDISEQTLQSDVSRYQERVVRRIGDRFVLHPRQLVIGSTLEYIQLPTTIMAYVVGKSTWGRTGLVIATATKVDPGFRGCITLEIINEGEVPLVLLPGIPIAQLVFHRTERPAEYSGSYSCPIGPEFPRFSSLVDGAGFWMPKRVR
jgi:dCTP deaminase